MKIVILKLSNKIGDLNLTVNLYSIFIHKTDCNYLCMYVFATITQKVLNQILSSRSVLSLVLAPQALRS